VDRTEKPTRYLDNDQRVAVQTLVSGGVETDGRMFVFGNYLDEVPIMLKICYVGGLKNKIESTGQSILRKNPGITVTVCGCDGEWNDRLGKIPGMPRMNCKYGWGYCDGNIVCVSIN
jgi:hypothetical protein